MTYSSSPNSGQPSRKLWKRIVLGFIVLMALGAGIFMAGPRNEFGASVPTQRTPPPETIAALDEWVKTSEAAFPDIKPGNAKGIVWNSGAKERTPWAVVYIHGFSASRLETAPVGDLVAKALGANAFHTRLAGHGRPGAAMGEATVQDWMADALEAVRIGQTLGERVLVISCSTGSTLATWLAMTPEGSKIAAHVFVSPNFGPKDKRSELINGPWGKQIAYAILGDQREWKPDSAAEANAWTSNYPTKALFPMMSMVKHVRDSDLSTFLTPVLVLYSENDQTVDPVETQSAFTRIASPLKSMNLVDYSKSKGQHVLAGDIKDPDAVAPMVASIVKWTSALPKENR